MNCCRARLITQQDRMREVMAFWRENYPKHKDSPYWVGTDKMLELGDRATVADFEAHGKLADTLICCNVCSERFTEVLQLGDEPDYDSQTVNICRGCAAALPSLFDAEGRRRVHTAALK